MRRTVLLSFDVEDWFQVENLRPLYPLESWEEQELRVGIGTRRVLEILRRHGVRATFFTLAWIAERAPELIEEILADGHELASHGSSHVMPLEQSIEEFRADVRAAKGMLEKLSGRRIRGYRAPSFAIDDARLRVLFEEGHDYDSSDNAVALHDLYGKLGGFGGSIVPGVRKVIGGGYEFSIPIARFGPLAIPVGGGAYFRLYPAVVFRALARRARSNGGPIVLYLHPWELDPDRPRVTGKIRASHRFRHYQNLERTSPRLDQFIQSFRRRGARFLTMGGYLDEIVAPERVAV